MELLSREDFKEEVFNRDGHKCVICGKPAVDAHHIIDRALWSDGGYYLDNGASVCADCHLDAESTEISCTELRKACGISTVLMPEHFYTSNEYDKWGNIVLPNKMRVKGEMFHDEGVQKIIKPVLHLFREQVKYPRTYHLPYSASRTSDDKTLTDVDHFIGREVVVTEKMDGENTSIYHNYTHARSLENEPHESRNWVKQFASTIGYELPDGWRLCGENLYAKHSLGYEDLESYFYLFSIWDDKNYCLSWDDTVEYCNMLGIHTVPVLWRGIWNEEQILKLIDELDPEKQEGFVVRLADGFEYGAFKYSVAKHVRANHVQTDEHWKKQKVVKNGLKDVTT